MPDLVPPRFVAESLLDAFPDPPAAGQGRVLLVRAAVARDVLPAGLAARGWRVDVVDAYRSLPVPLSDGPGQGRWPRPRSSRSRRRPR